MARREPPRSMDVPLPPEGRNRAVIDAVLPCVDAGRFAVKRIAGESFEVLAHCFTDGHDVPRVQLCWWSDAEPGKHEIEMRHVGNDEWSASFVPPVAGTYRYQVHAWVCHFRSWRNELVRREDPADIRLATLIGADLLDAAAGRAKGEDKKRLLALAKDLRRRAKDTTLDAGLLKANALEPALAVLVDRHPDKLLATQSAVFPLLADRIRARFSSWYELFPRSTAMQAGQHGGFKDVARLLPYVAELGFDVLYFPPIHPIGRKRRKGRDNALVAEADDVGSPWAIGAEEGGHKDILPALGTLEDFRALVERAKEFGIEIALDIAFQCAPDHPDVEAHPEWFRWRPDGTVQYAENPPKKYQDIYPFNFEADDWQELWLELKSVFDHWIAQGVKIFRVDNPHTKAFAFWEWAIAAIRRVHPEVLFLAEAFTRPKVMHRLAKLGFSQSYTYFTWRHTKLELTDYFLELSQGPGRDYFRPNAWPNTPDILNEQLQGASRPMFAIRLVLAATLSANYGIYGPAFELLENEPRSPGSEEYLHSEKYQLRQWDRQCPDSLAPLITRVNRIRHQNPALQTLERLRFCAVDNDQLIAYVKHTEDGSNVILTVVNLDPRYKQSGWIDIDLERLQPGPPADYEVHDLLSGEHFTWHGRRNFVLLDPAQAPAHIFRLRLRLPVPDEPASSHPM